MLIMKYETPKVIDLSMKPLTGQGHPSDWDCNTGSGNNYDCLSQGNNAGSTCGTGSNASSYCISQGIGGHLPL